MNNLLPRLPFAEWIDNGVDWLVREFSGFFDGIATGLEWIVTSSVEWMAVVPSILMAFIFAGLAWAVSTRKIAFWTLIGFLFIDYLGL